MRSKFDEQLSELKKDLIETGALCEEALTLLAQTLATGDLRATRRIPAIESLIDRLDAQVEANCVKMLLQQQPVASDLRQITAGLKMITDFERIGDQAEDIAEILNQMRDLTPAETEDLRTMAENARQMVTECVDAYVRQDVKLAHSVMEHDEIVDEYFAKVKKDLIALIGAHPEEGEEAIDVLMLAKYLERIADHSVNVAEWVEFAVTGIHKGEIA